MITIGHDPPDPIRPAGDPGPVPLLLCFPTHETTAHCGLHPGSPGRKLLHRLTGQRLLGGGSRNAGPEMSLDSCVEYLASDEILEVTPSLFRMSKNPDAAKKKAGAKK